MRKTRTQEEKERMFFLFYLGAHVLACGLGYLLGKYLFETILRGDSIYLSSLILLYVVHFFATAAGLRFVSVLSKRLSLFGFFRRLNMFLFAFLFHLVLVVLVASSILLIYWRSDWVFELTVLLGIFALIYFILPLGVSFFIMNLVSKAMGYDFGPEEKAMVQ